jgi:hypothetical protein
MTTKHLSLCSRRVSSFAIDSLQLFVSTLVCKMPSWWLISWLVDTAANQKSLLLWQRKSAACVQHAALSMINLRPVPRSRVNSTTTQRGDHSLKGNPIASRAASEALSALDAVVCLLSTGRFSATSRFAAMEACQ